MPTRARGTRRECPVQVTVGTCGGYTAPGQLMCRFHWRKVPPGLRNDVWRTWGRWNEAHSDEAWTEYAQARTAALEAVQR